MPKGGKRCRGAPSFVWPEALDRDALGDHREQPVGSVADERFAPAREDDDRRRSECLANVRVVVGAHHVVAAVVRPLEGGRVRLDEGEGVHHDDPTATPRAREADAFGDRLVVVHGARLRWVLPHEHRDRKVVVPNPPQSETVAPARREDGAATRHHARRQDLHGRSCEEGKLIAHVAAFVQYEPAPNRARYPRASATTPG